MREGEAVCFHFILHPSAFILYFMNPQGIAILGSTGSIGCNTLNVVESFGNERFRVVALAAGRNVARLAEQVERHRPELVAVEDEDCAEQLRKELVRRGATSPRVLV